MELKMNNDELNNKVNLNSFFNLITNKYPLVFDDYHEFVFEFLGYTSKTAFRDEIKDITKESTETMQNVFESINTSWLDCYNNIKQNEKESSLINFSKQIIAYIDRKENVNSNRHKNYKTLLQNFNDCISSNKPENLSIFLEEYRVFETIIKLKMDFYEKMSKKLGEETFSLIDGMNEGELFNAPIASNSHYINAIKKALDNFETDLQKFILINKVKTEINIEIHLTSNKSDYSKLNRYLDAVLSNLEIKEFQNQKEVAARNNYEILNQKITGLGVLLSRINKVIRDMDVSFDSNKFCECFGFDYKEIRNSYNAKNKLKGDTLSSDFIKNFISILSEPEKNTIK